VKRMLSVLLIAVLLLSLIPAGAAAIVQTSAEETVEMFGYFNFSAEDGKTKKSDRSVVRYIQEEESNVEIPAGYLVGNTGGALYGFSVSEPGYGLYFGGSLLNDVPDGTAITYAIGYYIDSETPLTDDVLLVTDGAHGEKKFANLEIGKVGVVYYHLTAKQVDAIQNNQTGGDTRLRLRILDEGVDKLYITGVRILNSQYVDDVEKYFSYTITDGKAIITQADTALSGNLSIPSGWGSTPLVRIQDGAFKKCTALTSVRIPDGVTSVGSYAFAGCTALTAVVIPASMEHIVYGAFRACPSLTDVYYMGTKDDRVNVEMGGDNEALVNATWHYLCQHEYGDDGICDLCGKTRYYTYEVNDGEATITGAEESVSGNVVIPMMLDGYLVKGIGSDAFKDCTKIVSVSIPDGVEVIKTGAFSGCTSLTSVVIPGSVSGYYSAVFMGCTALRDVTISDGVKNIGMSMFSGCTALESIVIPNSVEDIGMYAFAGCTALRSISIPDSTYLESGAFSDCRSLTAVTIPACVTRILDHTFYGCIGLRSITIPDGVKVIYGDAFNGCSGLTSVTLPLSVREIQGGAFYGCNALKDVHYGGDERNRESISIYDKRSPLRDATWHYSCVHRQTTLKGAVDPNCSADGYTGDTICSSCDAVVARGETIPALGHTYTDGADYDCNVCGARRFYTYTFADGAITITDVDTAISGDVVIPATIGGYPVTAIGDSAFNGCVNITSVVIPESIESFGNNAFKDCTALHTVYLNAVNATAKGKGAYPVFGGCTALTTVYIGKTVGTVPAHLFRPKSGSTEPAALTTVYLTKNTTVIDTHAFHQCTNITAVYFVGTAGDFGNVSIKSYNSALTAGTVTVSYNMPCFNEHEWTADCDTTCDLCGEERVGTHTDITDDAAVAPTCTETGLTAGSHCAACGNVIVKQNIVPALGHTWDAGEVLTAPTEFENGEKKYTCTACGDTKLVPLNLGEIRDGYYYYNGVRTGNAGLVQVEDAYYFITSTGAVKTGRYAVSNVNDTGIAKGIYYFFPDGKMNTAVGVYEGQYYNAQGKSEAYVGLIEWNGAKYYIGGNGGSVTTGRYFISKLNDLLPKKRAYTFFDDGRMLEDTRIHTDGYYYENGIRIPYAGLVEYEGELYYVADHGAYVKNKMQIVVNVNNTGKKKNGRYYFDENGHMMYNVIRDGKYYGADGLAPYATGVVEVDGKFYYNNGNHGALRVNATFTISAAKTNGLIAAGKYTADENGVLTPA